MSGVLHTELDAKCCAHLRHNFPDDDVIERDIRELQPENVLGFRECHFFAGIGGFALGLRWAEWDRPIWTGGFPCQDISVAGKGVGLGGSRSGLWFEWLRLIRACRPVRLLVENVPALRTRGADEILASLEECGYSCWPIVVGADLFGLHQKRNRIWIVANSVRSGCSEFTGLPTKTRSSGREAAFMDIRPVVRLDDRRTEPEVVRMVHGFPGRVDCIRALGNAVVPQVVEAIARAWIKAEDACVNGACKGTPLTCTNGVLGP
jgi:site-specific DNA-cytosine methylase